MRAGALLMVGLSLAVPAADAAAPPRIRVGSKHFTEGYLLAEMLAQALEAHGFAVDRVHGLGGTMVCFQALVSNEIDVYSEYTGTIEQEILRSSRRLDDDELRRELHAKHNLTILPSLGFNNTYAIALTRARATELGVARISDLARHQGLKGGVSYEFLERKDGWPKLAAAYGLPFQPVGMEHGLAYDALRSGQIDFTDAYTTDAKIAKFDLAVLEDDRAFFPRYAAVPLLREQVAGHLAPALAPLAGRLDEATMRRLNARVEIDRVPFATIAHEWLVSQNLVSDATRTAAPTLAARLLARTWRHVWLTLVALLAAVALAIPLGIAAYLRPRWAAVVIPVAGLLQTIPSIALLAMMIPLLGIGTPPTIAALFLYGLLPIVRNTFVGLSNVDAQYRTIGLAMGLTAGQRLRWVEMPLAMPVVLAGIKTAAVINIGTATLAAFVGAGGLGEPIVTGLALNDPRMILEGAIPAALLALATELAFRPFEATKKAG